MIYRQETESRVNWRAPPVPGQKATPEKTGRRKKKHIGSYRDTDLGYKLSTEEAALQAVTSPLPEASKKTLEEHLLETPLTAWGPKCLETLRH